MTSEELQAIVESNARSIAATNEGIAGLRSQQEINTANITDLITLSSNVLRAVDGLVTKIDESNRRFDILREDAIADRQRADAQFQAALENMQRLFLELNSTNRRVDNLEQAS